GTNRARAGSGFLTVVIASPPSPPRTRHISAVRTSLGTGRGSIGGGDPRHCVYAQIGQESGQPRVLSPHRIAAMRRFLATVGCAAALVACGGMPEASAPRVDRAGLGVVAVDARIGGDVVHSSGIVVDGESGLVLTAAHGVWGAR